MKAHIAGMPESYPVTSTINQREISWTPEQLAVFAHFADSSRSHLVVRARAGTGKTTVILSAVSYAAWATSILIAAFNKRIADELATKCRDARATIKTWHGVGFGFLRTLGKLRVESDREAKIARTLVPKDDWQVALLAAKLAVKVKEIAPFGSLQEAVDLAWRFDCLPAEDTSDHYTVEDVARLAITICERSKSNTGEISFADMLYLPLVLGLIKPMYDLVVVDEAQDLSPAQILMAQRAVRKSGRIVVVGDDRQGIYAFRGADSNTIDNLKAELGAEELGLTVTHRCPKSIVAYAATLVPDYTAADSAPEGTISTITRSDLYARCKPGSFVLSRKNAPLMGVCLGFLRRGIRAKIQGKDIGSQLNNLVKKLAPTSIPDLVTKLGTWQTKEIERARARGNGVGKSREEVVCDIADCIFALTQDLKDINELTSKLYSLFDEAPSVESSAWIVCSSVHKAKGLEAAQVYILKNTLYSGDRNREEQNIEYVAVTRTKADMFWVVPDSAE